MTDSRWPIDPSLDLVFEREVPIPAAKVWAAWTRPEHARHWFAPRPYTVVECEIDLRPGGIFRHVMQSPDGEIHPDPGGCILELVENRRLVFTDALGPAFRPKESGFFTCEPNLETVAGGTRYSVIARHPDPAACDKHREMGFETGWGTALDQLVEYMSGLS